jgi:hypothetical protein
MLAAKPTRTARASEIPLVVAQVRQALQQTAAAGALSPYFVATSAMRPVQICLMHEAYAGSRAAGDNRGSQGKRRQRARSDWLRVAHVPRSCLSRPRGEPGGSSPPPRPPLRRGPAARRTASPTHETRSR